MFNRSPQGLRQGNSSTGSFANVLVLRSAQVINPSVVAGSSLPVLLDLWAAWCGPCRMIAPVIEQLASELSGRVLVGKLDVDANPQTSASFGVQSIPTLLILKDGREVDRLIGAQSKNAILQRLQRFI